MQYPRKPRILCVDDDDDLRASIADGLSEMGLDVKQAGSGEAAVETVLREGTDLVVLDYGLPGMDGLAACRAIKTLAGDAFLPVLFLSAHQDLDLRVRVLDAGGDEFCVKPLALEELAARIRVLLRARDREARLEHETGKFRRLALVDPLTELWNRRALVAELEREWARHLRHGRPLSLIVADVDRFKQINDRYGHSTGDRVLRTIAGALGRAIRQGDSTYRTGGDELAVLLPDTDLRGAVIVAERARAEAAARTIHDGFPATLSLGIAAIPDPAITGSDELLDAADRALYEAKTAGRDRVAGATSRGA